MGPPALGVTLECFDVIATKLARSGAMNRILFVPS